MKTGFIEYLLRFPIPSNNRNGFASGNSSQLPHRNGETSYKDDDPRSEHISQALSLLDAARTRVLTMSEQRVSSYNLSEIDFPVRSKSVFNNVFLFQSPIIISFSSGDSRAKLVD